MCIRDSIDAMDISGRYGVLLGGTNLYTLELKGADVASLIAHSAEAGSLNVLKNAQVNQDLVVRGGIKAGVGGIYTDGQLTAYATTSLLGRVGIGTINPVNFKLQVAGHVGPHANNTYDLGSAAYKWRNIYTNDLTAGDLNISPRNPTYVKGLDWGYVRAIDVMGKYAYVGHTQVGVNEFTIFDVSDNANPQALGGVDIGTNHIVYDVEVVGQYAYIAQTSDASGSKEIQLIDVSNPNAPAKVSGVNTAAAECNDVLVSGNYVYAACYNVTDSVADLYIIDYTDKNNPIITTSTNITADNAYSLVKYGDYLIVGTDDATNYNVGADILIFNVANPYLATYVGGYNVGTNPITAMELLGNNLYVGSLSGVNGYEFMIFDVGDPANIAYKGGVDLYADYVRGIQAGTEYVTVLQSNGVASGADLYTINVASTTNPSINSSMDAGAGTFYALKADGTKLYIGGTNETISGQYTALEFLIFDQSGVITPSADIGDLFVGNMNVGQDARFNKDVYINSGLTVGDYGINTFGQLSVASTSKFLSLMRTSDIRPLTHDAYDLGTDAFRYQDAYFSRTVETEPTTAVRLGGYNVGGTVTATYVQGKYLYVGTQDETVTGRTEDFQIYDISDPNNPQYISGVSIGGSYSVNAIQVIGSYAYLTYFISGNNSGALYVYDVSDPKNIVYKDHIINSINSNPYALAVNGDYAYYLSHDSGTTNRLSVVNVSNPGDITLQKTINMTGGTFQSSLTVANGNLYVGSTNVTTYSSYDLIIFNLDNPGNPVYAGGANIDASNIYEVYVSGRYAYVGTTGDNIYIVDISSSTVPVIKSTIDAGGNDIQKIRLMDKYMVVGTVNNGTGAVNEVLVYDVSSSTSVGSPIMEINVGGSTIRDMVLYGKNLIVGTLNATTNAEDFQIYDLGGIRAQAADIGSLRSSLLRVTEDGYICLLYTSPSPRDRTRSRMPSSA